MITGISAEAFRLSSLGSMPGSMPGSMLSSDQDGFAMQRFDDRAMHRVLTSCDVQTAIFQKQPGDFGQTLQRLLYIQVSVTFEFVGGVFHLFSHALVSLVRVNEC